MSNKQQLQENNLDLQYILELLSSFESSQNLLTQNNTIVGTLSKTSDGYKLGETEDPFGEIETQSPLLAQLVDLVSKKYMIEGNYVWKKYEYNSESSAVEDFIEYVISNASDTYPDGGVQDGYWYEKVSEGIPLSLFNASKYETGSLTFSSRTQLNNASIRIRHSLGVIPKLFMICTTAETITDGYDIGFCFMANGGISNVSDVGTFRLNSTSTGLWGLISEPFYGHFSKTVITLPDTDSYAGATDSRFTAGVPYTWIAMA